MIKARKKKVILGMSGGVDSSVSLFLLKEQGFDVIGATVKFNCWKNAKNAIKENICCSEYSIDQAKRTCKKFNVPHFVIDASEQFKETVIEYFIKTLKDNKTPSPCLFCNRSVKIRTLLDLAKQKGADYVATGHYARTIEKNGEFQLQSPKDKEKDQTYFLAFLSQKQISKLIFPLGNLTKKEVYKIAEKEKLYHVSRESQDLCFVADKSLPAFLEKEIGLKRGKIYDIKGNILGEHKGLHFFTRGQRKGINLPGGPFWVVDFNKNNNNLIVSNDRNEKSFFSKELELSGVNFISGNPFNKKTKILVRTRFRQPLVKASLSIKDSRAKLIFNIPQRSVAPGQIAVFYTLPKGEICLGGGMIELTK